MSQLKIKDGNSWINIPAGGIGVPSGGNQGDVLVKSSATDYATEWALPLSMKLLWTNPNPTSAFPAQTVSLNLSNYDAVLIKMTVNNLSQYESTTSEGTSICFKGRASASFNGIINNNYFNMVRFAVVSNSGIDFSDGYANMVTNNNYAVPLKIYGIKGIT